ncbi:SRPBCC domain-containing protein [Pseudonocardia sp. CA-142604]|uniref:SRPBCC domain-containing protein n=1 Tax=Pseudonocardia sp. CA-142604 TaxID=3240024 RepID=UPI003D8C7996
MKVGGQFTVASSVGALRVLETQPEKLAGVASLSDVVSTPDGGFTALFTPATPFGRQPIATRVATERADERGAALRVHGRRGPHVIDVELTISFVEASEGTIVGWEADVWVRGPAASVGQRVALDVARRAIGDLLVSSAACA